MILAANEQRILDELAGGALVLDVGGWADPFARADWVIDLMPYETRGLYGGKPDPERERFSAQTWVVRDVCDRDPWPFSDGQFDFAVCSQTLEDLRDPVGVCRELQRIARAGYVEVPTRLAEQSAGVEGAWPGWSHHHWICDVEDGRRRASPSPSSTTWCTARPTISPRRSARARARPPRPGPLLDGLLRLRGAHPVRPEALEAELRETVDDHRAEVPRRWRIR